MAPAARGEREESAAMNGLPRKILLVMIVAGGLLTLLSYAINFDKHRFGTMPQVSRDSGPGSAGSR